MQRLWSMPNAVVASVDVAAAGDWIVEAHVIHADARRQVLQLAVAVGDADRADVVALGEQQLDDHPAVVAQPLA